MKDLTSEYNGSIYLGDKRGGLSLGADENFINLLENDKPVELTPEETEELNKKMAELSAERRNRKTIYVSSDHVAAALIRKYQPNIILAGTVNGKGSLIEQFNRQMGRQSTLKDFNGIANRLEGRDAAVVILNVNNPEDLPRGIKDLPTEGVLILSK